MIINDKRQAKSCLHCTQGQELILLPLPGALQTDDHIVLGKTSWQTGTQKTLETYRHLFLFQEYSQLIFSRKQWSSYSLGFSVIKKKSKQYPKCTGSVAKAFSYVVRNVS